jgi:hypothetical protein
MLIPSHILVVPTESCLVHLASLATSVKPYPGQGHALVQNNVLNLRDASFLPVVQGLWSSAGKSLNHLDLLFPVKHQFFCVLSYFFTIVISTDGKLHLQNNWTFLSTLINNHLNKSQQIKRNRNFNPYLFSNKKQKDCHKATMNLMFCWPRIIVYQYNETDVMHFYSIY